MPSPPACGQPRARAGDPRFPRTARMHRPSRGSAPRAEPRCAPRASPAWPARRRRRRFRPAPCVRAARPSRSAGTDCTRDHDAGGTHDSARRSAASRYFSINSGGSASVDAVVSNPSPTSSAGSSSRTSATEAPSTSRTAPAYCARLRRRTTGTSRASSGTTAVIAATASPYSRSLGRTGSSAGGMSRFTSRLRSDRRTAASAEPAWSTRAMSSPPLARAPSWQSTQCASSSGRSEAGSTTGSACWRAAGACKARSVMAAATDMRNYRATFTRNGTAGRLAPFTRFARVGLFCHA